jgi:hypothetical protein
MQAGDGLGLPLAYPYHTLHIFIQIACNSYFPMLQFIVPLHNMRAYAMRNLSLGSV